MHLVECICVSVHFIRVYKLFRALFSRTLCVYAYWIFGVVSGMQIAKFYAEIIFHASKRMNILTYRNILLWCTIYDDVTCYWQPNPKANGLNHVMNCCWIQEVVIVGKTINFRPKKNILFSIYFCEIHFY